jgi:hypothetical protein
MRFLLGFLLAFLVAAPALAAPKVLTAASLGGNINQSPMAVSGQLLSIHCVTSSASSPIGTINIRGSDLDAPAPATAADWIDLDGTSQSLTSSSTHGWDIDTKFQWIDINYARTSGSGTIDCYMNRVNR